MVVCSDVKTITVLETVPPEKAYIYSAEIFISEATLYVGEEVSFILFIKSTSGSATITLYANGSVMHRGDYYLRAEEEENVIYLQPVKFEEEGTYQVYATVEGVNVVTTNTITVRVVAAPPAPPAPPVPVEYIPLMMAGMVTGAAVLAVVAKKRSY